MKRIIIGVLGVLVMAAAGGAAQAAPIMVRSTECTKTVSYDDAAIQAQLDGTATPDGSFLKEKNGQKFYLYCMDSAVVQISETKHIRNNTQYPFVIFGLNLNGDLTQKSNAVDYVPSLHVKGAVVLQGLTIINARGPVTIADANAAIVSSTITCSTKLPATSTTPILDINGNTATITNLTIIDCLAGISVAGIGNTLKTVSIANAAGTGTVGVQVTGLVNSFDALKISGYHTAAAITGSSVTLKNSTLTRSAPLGAVSTTKQIGVVAGASSTISASAITGFDVAVHVQGDKVTIQNDTLSGNPAISITPNRSGVQVRQCTFTKSGVALGISA